MTTRLTSPRRIGVLIVVLALAGLVFAMPSALSANAATTATVGVGGAGGVNVFTPNTVNISVGDSVTFNWVDGVHDAKNATTGALYFPLSVSSDATAASQTTTFTTPGTYYFYCSVHAKAADATDAIIAAGTKQVGKIVVAGASTPTTTTTATPTKTATPTATPTPGTTPVAAPPLTVVMPADYFNPAAMTVNPGDTVTFKNADADLHTITSVPGNSPAPINLIVKPGESAKFTFTIPGVYWYYCNAHASWDAANGQVKANDSVDDPSEPMEGFILVLGPAVAPATGTVNIPTGTKNNDSFRSVVTTVQAGAVVTWNNQDGDLHTVVSVPGSNAAEKINLAMPTGKTAQFTFKTPGLYWYYCNAHANFDTKTGQVSAHEDTDQPHEPMMGVIAVLAAPATPTPAPATPVATVAPPVAPRPPSTGSGATTNDSGSSPWLLASVGLILSGLIVTVATRRRI